MQDVRTRLIWSREPALTVPVLAVTAWPDSTSCSSPSPRRKGSSPARSR